MRTLDALLIGLVGLCIAVGITLALVFSSQQPISDNCYFVTDAAGVEHTSFSPTSAGLQEGRAIVVFDTDNEWGYVFDPVSTRADKDCLRARGVEVPTTQGREDQNGDQ